MVRAALLNELRSYHGTTIQERQMVADTIAFIETHDCCFERRLAVGHITASACITDAAFENVLLVHHVKLDKWFQPGGHCDGNPDTLEVALKEATEETLLKVTAIRDTVFDVDIHIIPARGDVPAHLHYDIRYLMVCEVSGDDLQGNNEVKECRWVALKDVKSYNPSESLLRMVRKIVRFSVTQ
jgi:8-oxo-dGTP pyrophosphatase MutT (NUDIX family)